MVKLNGDFSLSYKSGYFQAHKHGRRGDEAKNPGEDCILWVRTYSTVLSVWHELKKEGVAGNAIMRACDKLLHDNQQAVSKAFLKAKEAAKNKELLK